MFSQSGHTRTYSLHDLRLLISERWVRSCLLSDLGINQGAFQVNMHEVVKLPAAVEQGVMPLMDVTHKSTPSTGNRPAKTQKASLARLPRKLVSILVNVNLP